jgi:hypothetical protein
LPFVPDNEYEQLQADASFMSLEKRKELGIDDLTSLDQRLVNYAGALPPTKIAELTGLTPEEVAQRTLAVLNSIDYFTIDQMRAKLMITLNALIAEAMNRLPTASERAIGAYLNATGGNLQRGLAQLKEMEERALKNSASMEQAYARRMVDIVNRAFDRQLGKLSERYPEIDPSDIAEEFQKTIMEIAKEIDNGA